MDLEELLISLEKYKPLVAFSDEWRATVFHDKSYIAGRGDTPMKAVEALMKELE